MNRAPQDIALASKSKEVPSVLPESKTKQEPVEVTLVLRRTATSHMAAGPAAGFNAKRPATQATLGKHSRTLLSIATLAVDPRLRTITAPTEAEAATETTVRVDARIVTEVPDAEATYTEVPGQPASAVDAVNVERTTDTADRVDCNTRKHAAILAVDLSPKEHPPSSDVALMLVLEKSI
jgi:hypothetical protein